MEDYWMPFMDNAKIDELSPLFEMPAYDPVNDEETSVSNEQQEWKWTVLFFYPADFTFVCPTELKDLEVTKSKFDEMNTTIISVSTDTVYSHRGWVKQEWLIKNFPYLMASDHNLEVSNSFWILDNETWLAWRWTFIIDPDWIIKSIEITSGPLWRNSDELVRKIQALQYMREHTWEACPAKWVLWNKTLSPSIKIAWEVSDQL